MDALFACCSVVFYIIVYLSLLLYTTSLNQCYKLQSVVVQFTLDFIAWSCKELTHHRSTANCKSVTHTSDSSRGTDDAVVTTTNTDDVNIDTDTSSNSQPPVYSHSHVPLSLISDLLVQFEEKSDSHSQTIVKSLVKLRDERQGDYIPQKYYGILKLLAKAFCAKHDFKNALIFYLEMLRLWQTVFMAVQGPLSWQATFNLSLVQFNIAICLRNLNRFQDALEYLTQILTLVYSDTDVATKSSITTSNPQAKLVQGDNGVNIPQYAAQLYFRVWEEYGYNQYHLRLYNDALLSYQVAIKLHQDILGNCNLSPRTILRLAMLQIELKQPDMALAAIRDMSTIDVQPFQDVYNPFLVAIKRISSLFESEGNHMKAIDTLRIAILIHDSFLAVDEISRLEIVGQMLYQIAEILQSMNQLTAAIQAVSESVYYCRQVVNQTENGVLSNSDDKKIVYVYTIKQLVLALQLLGTLHYEMCEPLRGQAVLKEAMMNANNVPNSLIELHEAVECRNTDSVFFVMLKFSVSVLANECCAPKA